MDGFCGSSVGTPIFLRLSHFSQSISQFIYIYLSTSSSSSFFFVESPSLRFRLYQQAGPYFAIPLGTWVITILGHSNTWVGPRILPCESSTFDFRDAQNGVPMCHSDWLVQTIYLIYPTYPLITTFHSMPHKFPTRQIPIDEYTHIMYIYIYIFVFTYKM